MVNHRTGELLVQVTKGTGVPMNTRGRSTKKGQWTTLLATLSGAHPQ